MLPSLYRLQGSSSLVGLHFRAERWQGLYPRLKGAKVRWAPVHQKVMEVGWAEPRPRGGILSLEPHLASNWSTWTSQLVTSVSQFSSKTQSRWEQFLHRCSLKLYILRAGQPVQALSPNPKPPGKTALMQNLKVKRVFLILFAIVLFQQRFKYWSSERLQENLKSRWWYL